MKFTGKNFQAWGEFDLDIQGLTVVTGPSDKGKSALFRALRGIFYNDLSEAFIRDGSPGLELAVEWDGTTIKASRAVEESAKYQIGEKKFTKLGGRRPEELKAFGVNDIRIGDTTLDPIFAIQNDTQFLIQGVGPGELNNILGGFASTEKLEYGKREANLRIQQKNSEAKTLATEVYDAEVRRARFEQNAKAVEPISAVLDALEPQVYALEEKCITINHAVVHKMVLMPMLKALSQLEVPEVTPLVRTYRKIQHTQAAISAGEARHVATYAQQYIEDAVAAWREVKKLWQGILSSNEIKDSVSSKDDISDFSLKTAFAQDSLTQAFHIHARINQLKFCVNLKKICESLQAEYAQVIEELDTLSMFTCPKCGERFTNEFQGN